MLQGCGRTNHIECQPKSSCRALRGSEDSDKSAVPIQSLRQDLTTLSSIQAARQNRQNMQRNAAILAAWDGPPPPETYTEGLHRLWPCLVDEAKVLNQALFAHFRVYVARMIVRLCLEHAASHPHHSRELDGTSCIASTWHVGRTLYSLIASLAGDPRMGQDRSSVP